MSNVSSMDMSKRDRVRNGLAIDFFAIHGKHAGATLGRAGAVIFEGEHDGVLAGAERRLPYHLKRSISSKL